METSNGPAPSAPRRLVRSRSNKWIAGVAGGMGDYFKVDATLVRLTFVALTIFWGIGIPLYLFAWLIIPREGEVQSIGDRLVTRVKDEVPPTTHGS